LKKSSLYLPPALVAGGLMSSLALGQTAPAPKQASADLLQAVIVTGSRVITNGNDSPTPLTVVTTAQLTSTTPTNLADALNNLPIFSGSSGPTNARQSTLDNTAGNFLDLRGLGSVRNLILLDGTRVPPTSAAGTVDVDSLPQMLVQRVDVVTGGASAVYGSDAISGVVNYVLDHHFNGVKLEASGGISDMHDDETGKFGIAAGTLFDGTRGHVEFSFEHFKSNGIANMSDRSAGREVYTVDGAGTAASPYHTVPGGALVWATAGGYFIPAVPGPLAGETFTNNNGALATATPSDFSYVQDATPMASLKNDDGFGRIDFDLTDRLHVYSQLDFTATANQYQLSPMLYVYNWILPDDAYLPAAASAALEGPGGGPVLFGKDSNTIPGFIGDSHGHNFFGTMGLSGKVFSDADFTLTYTHGESRQITETLNNINALHLAAALNAVDDPSTGQIVCGSSLTDPAAFPGCVPLDPFGPNPETPAMLSYLHQNTYALVVNKTDDVAANIVGDTFSTWAGAVRSSLSAELRHMSLTNSGSGTAVTAADCAGLTLAALTCPSTLFTSPTSGAAYGSESVREVALETNVPLLSGLPLARELDLNGAFRNAKYSISGPANTWKVGLVWNVNDELTFRGTRSRDFRAPTLFDLFAPASVDHSGYTDLHTGVNGITDIETSGNPDLKPEVGETTTVGFVFRPHWIHDLSLAVDLYEITISNAISQFSGADPEVQQECEQSGGTSPACSLFVRPLPFDNHSPANFPTLVYVEELNLSSQKAKGMDVDLIYGRRFGPGLLSLRALTSWQPSNETQLYPGAPIVQGAGTAPGVSENGAASVTTAAGGLAKWRVTGFASYALEHFEVDLQTRWRSHLQQTNSTAVSSDPPVPSVAFTDLTVAYLTSVLGADSKFYLTVQDLFGTTAPIWQTPGSSSAPGYFYPAVNGDDIVGRYFTVGLKAEF
jgi:outer membrane receptor protein involved in Fe transport